ncbi:hypothetical protein [Dyadobacter sandarakinus]|uniref:HEPN AbiU2-like domain-containing protein n=1 Tax=Dyadobacter sandarakinus TaxID=2747268 RepID=A0ABX7I6M3_9BACT|nr:hypothetical protein [Dyadobacter sandarakinus]QRR01545.1 hypothetical protein HWI92_11825 [Dyadobacter sandarakinus]
MANIISNNLKERFIDAKLEFVRENDDGKHRLVYAYFGLAIYYAQCLEEEFSLMLWTNRIINNKPSSKEDVEAINAEMDKSKKTMGQLINEVKKAYAIQNGHAQLLSNLLEKRNYLAHKYFKLHIEKFYTEIGQLEMINFFCDFIDKTIELIQNMNSYYQFQVRRLGFTESKISELKEVLRQQELERVSNL